MSNNESTESSVPMAAPSRYCKFLQTVKRDGVWHDAIELCLQVTYNARHRLKQCEYDLRNLHKTLNDQIAKKRSPNDIVDTPETKAERIKRDKAEDDLAQSAFATLRDLEIETQLPGLCEKMVAEDWTVCELVSAFRDMHAGYDSLEDLYVAFKTIDLHPRSYGRLRRKLQGYEKALFCFHAEGDHRPTLECFFWLLFGGPVVQKDGRGGGINVLSELDKLNRLRREAEEPPPSPGPLRRLPPSAKPKSRFAPVSRRSKVVAAKASPKTKDYEKLIEEQEAKVALMDDWYDIANPNMPQETVMPTDRLRSLATAYTWDKTLETACPAYVASKRRRAAREVAHPYQREDAQLAADEHAVEVRLRLAEERREGRRLEHDAWVEAHPGQEAESPFLFWAGSWLE